MLFCIHLPPDPFRMLACLRLKSRPEHRWWALDLQGLELRMCDIKLSPSLLGKLATYASGKPECLKAVTRVLPDLCQVRSCSILQQQATNHLPPSTPSK